MIKTAFFDAKPYDEKSFSESFRNNDIKATFLPYHLNKETVSLANGYDAICAFVNDVLDKQVLDKLVEQGVKLVALRCAGYNNVDLKAAYNRIHVVRVPAYSPFAVAEHALTLMLTLNRKTHKAYNRIRENNFNINGLLGFDMHGKTAGIIGTGKIGQILIGILKGLGMNVIAYDKFPNKEKADNLDFEYVNLEQLFGESDIISLHCPLNSETVHLINDETIGKMKKGVMIINTGRGQLIDTKSLIKGLKDGIIGSAGLDVYEEESDYFFEDFSDSHIEDDVLARLLTFNNVLITSHQAFFTREALSNIADTTINNITDFFNGKALPNEVCYQCDKPECRKEKKGRCF